ncbi:MAG: hypothetical protein KA354_03025 [Phycisphaerae bacterium]|nr:hypothetical protein [Phycisphaerae bacterium]
MRKPRYLIWVAILSPAILAMGCNKVTPENYDKIQNQMTLTQVEQILGKGTEQSGGGLAVGDLNVSAKTVTWASGDKSITVTFANDKVVMKTKKGL